MDSDAMYSLIISQLLHDGYNIIAISLANLVKKEAFSHSPSDELLRILKLGSSVADFLNENSNKKNSMPAVAVPIMNVENISETIPNLKIVIDEINPIQDGKNSPATLEKDAPPNVSTPQITRSTLSNNSNAVHVNSNLKQDSGISPEIASLLQTPRRRLIGFEKDIITIPPQDDSKVRLFKCATCEKVYNRRDKARRHIIEIHYGIRAFLCQFCQKSFTRNDKLVRHVMNVHHHTPTFQCSHCPESFTLCSAYKRHLLENHSINFTRWEGMPQLVTPIGSTSYLDPMLPIYVPQAKITQSKNRKDSDTQLKAHLIDNSFVIKPEENTSDSSNRAVNETNQLNPECYDDSLGYVNSLKRQKMIFPDSEGFAEEFCEENILITNSSSEASVSVAMFPN